MSCPNCGKKLDEGSKFCGHCGSSIHINAMDFKKLSSAEIVRAINALPSDAQIIAYQKHSALVKEVGDVHKNNRPIDKCLSVLTSMGWTEASARDMLAWGLARAYIILARNPAGWSKGPNTRSHSDEEIKVVLREDKSLSEEIIRNIFQELKITS